MVRIRQKLIESTQTDEGNSQQHHSETDKEFAGPFVKGLDEVVLLSFNVHTIGFGASAAIAGYVWDEKRAIKMWCHVKKDFVLYKFKAHERQTCGARPDHHFTILLCHLEQIVSPGCIPLAVETYGNWGKVAHDMFSRLASYLAIHQTSPKSAVVTKLYGRLNIALVCTIARAILARELPPS
ncbi:hypothetical protein EMCRGX_G008537 [Ephydatia muelleri]